jgi:hypothetical protein
MNSIFKSTLRNLFMDPDIFFDIQALFDPDRPDARSSTAAFLLAMGGDQTALAFLHKNAETDPTTTFFLNSLGLIEKEIDRAVKDMSFVNKLKALGENPSDDTCLRNVLFPEGAGLPETLDERVQALREKRTIKITALNPKPLSNPGHEILFTSNVMLTVPAANTSLDELEYPEEMKAHIRQAMEEKQLYWFDHPIQIGVKPEANEILYGLRGLDEAVAFERNRGTMGDGKIACVLSASVTHNGLHALAKEYIELEIRNAGGFNHIDVYVFTEHETDRLIDEVLVPAGGHAQALDAFGIDGEYGRHYSFLKAISALWNASKDPNVSATFKIDLDQVFPQRELVEQTGASAFEHFMTPLWGGRGTDTDGQPVELGMIAGALVNERDIHKGLYTPDVLAPDQPCNLEERVFFSKMLMALSTAGEMGTRYGENGIDGETVCIQRIHVTGGMNGIRVDSLTQFRPFTPSFIGRAEDQAYILSTLMHEGEKLGYVHEDGLIMRHDKEAFAGDAMKAASFGNMIGDYIRTLYFSEYARVLTDDNLDSVKEIVNPFTGCFITPIPVTAVMMRFCMKAAGFFLDGEHEMGTRFVQANHPRLAHAMAFAQDGLREQYQHERDGWNQFYDLLERIRPHEELRAKAVEIIDSCHVQV